MIYLALQAHIGVESVLPRCHSDGLRAELLFTSLQLCALFTLSHHPLPCVILLAMSAMINQVKRGCTIAHIQQLYVY